MKTLDAIAVFGSVRELASALGVSVQAVYGWRDEVPRLRVYQIRELRPDFDVALDSRRQEAATPQEHAA